MFEHDPLATLLLVLTGFQVAALAAAWLVLRRRANAGHTGCPAWFEQLAERPRAALGLVFTVSVSLSILLAAAHWPVPRIQDEFSYRLAGETFAAGRMANPPHPMWPHFETEHVLQRPVYASKYPPMQGLSLALGNLIAGEPMVGVWLGLGAACAAVCWMFYAFLPSRWALLGGLLVASHPWILAWWGHSGWGGQMAMLGGALLFGSVRRIVATGRDERPRARHAVLMAVGLAVLANSRPYEGLVASVPAAVAMAWWLPRPGRPRPTDALARVVIPGAAVLALTGAAMTAYNQRVTGDPLKLPYQLHGEQYGATPMFVWQGLPPEPEYRDRKLRDFHAGWERSIAVEQQSAYGLSRKLLHKSLQLGGFYLGPALGLAVVGMCLVRRRCAAPADTPQASGRWTAFAAIAAASTVAASLLCVWFNPHYVAPVAPLLLLLAVVGLRRWAGSGERRARAATVIVAAHAATAAVLPVAAVVVYPTDDWSHARARMISDLAAAGGEHLVILRHGREYSPHEEWVYNGADIDGSKVVWARELDSASARGLRQYYAGRRHWLLRAYRPGGPGRAPAPVPTLVPYPDLPAWLEASPLRMLAGEPVGAVMIADLNGDGRGGLVAAPAGRAVLEVTRAGDWAAPVTIPIPAPASSLAAVADSSGTGTRIAATLIGRPTFALIEPLDRGTGRVSLIELPAEGRGVAVVPGEGLVAVACPSPAGVAVVGVGGGAGAPAWVPFGSEPHGVAAADLTGDGVADLAVSDRTGGAVWLLPGRREDGRWSAGEPARIADVPEALGLTVVRLGPDGSLGLAVASAARDLVVVLGRGEDGRFARVELNTGVVPLAVAAADVDGDGLDDLAVATRFGHGLTVLCRSRGEPGAGSAFAAPAEVTLGTGTWFVEKATRVAAGDLDGDGVGDLAVAAVDGVHVFLSRGRP